MVETIYRLKNKILQHVEKETANMDRIDVKEVGELVDMVKDLADAEKLCWEADYFRKVSEAMGQNTAGYRQPMRQDYGSTGYAPQSYGNTSSGYGSMGHGSLIDMLGEEYKKLSPDEQMMMRSQVLTKLGAL